MTWCPVLAASQTQHGNCLEYIGRLTWLCPFLLFKIHYNSQVILIYINDWNFHYLIPGHLILTTLCMTLLVVLSYLLQYWFCTWLTPYMLFIVFHLYLVHIHVKSLYNLHTITILVRYKVHGGSKGTRKKQSFKPESDTSLCK